VRPEGRTRPSVPKAPGYPVFVQKISRTWWLEHPGYRRFAARETTSVFVAAFSVLLLLFVFAVSRGREAFEGFLRWLALPGIIALHAVILVAVLYHMATWFRLTSRATVVRLGHRTIPRAAVEGAMYAAWLVASALVVYFLLWF
jgi:fumarate reductase subunit C